MGKFEQALSSPEVELSHRRPGGLTRHTRPTSHTRVRAVWSLGEQVDGVVGVSVRVAGGFCGVGAERGVVSEDEVWGEGS